MCFFIGLKNAFLPTLILWAIIIFEISKAFAEPVMLPPDIYDHKPLRNVPELFMNYWEIDAYCREHGIDAPSLASGYRLQACALKDNDNWFYIVLPNNEIDADELQLKRRHEWGHINGWPANHPGGRFLTS